ncbi:thiamine pyrophosphate-binding protein [Halarsenatibacter silvermanii]|uniref:Acetolactate synthase-1/2/3 large subunit n=1 Tax=Halarsenatibacter silvermanii TaxID=321763 RepID=A0A1G9J2Q6_9FIRM|nr:thiamine pyrophosphate-binding protein [Halarsenatibacter silvermanii]SDL31503.1 acetolactate synthase-1/2/3 large subunit [Halarsenatibacter silvermanii]
MDPWELLIELLKVQEVDTVFGLGDSYVNMLADQAGLQAINLRHESSAPFMAMAYSRLTGKAGVISASAGPGTANLTPGMLEALSGCTPIVALCHSAPVATHGRGEFQECDQVKMMEPVSKWSAQVKEAELLPWYLRRAFTKALSGVPGPVYLDLPDDIMGSGPFKGQPENWNLDQELVENQTRVTEARPAAARDDVRQAALTLVKAEKPVAIFGNGAVLARAFEQGKDFVESYGLPFLTTPGGRGLISEDHELALGVSGRYRTKPARKYYEKADLLITIGSSNEAFQTGHWEHFPEDARYIQLDIEPESQGRSWRPDIHLAGDVKEVLSQLLDEHQRLQNENLQMMERLQEKKAEIAEEVSMAKEKFAVQVKEETSELSYPLLAREVVKTADEIFGPEAILVNENGSQDIWSYFYPYFRVQSILGCIPVAEQTCMGMGVTGAIAAHLARPERPVLCITGDGAFQMYMQEMATAVQYEAGCTWLVLNNKGLGWIRAKQQKAGFPTVSTSFQAQPDLAQTAESFGCHGISVKDPDELRPALKSAMEANKKGKPAVVDCKIDHKPDMDHLDDGRWWKN